MESRLVPIFAFLLLAVALSHATLTSELYWDSLFPNTPMPKAVRDLLPQHGQLYNLGEEKSTSVRKGGIVVDNSKSGKSGTHVNVGKDIAGNRNYGGGGNRNYGGGGKRDQLHVDPNIAIFFVEKNLRAGIKMNLLLATSTTRATFLPRQIAEAIPFSYDKLPIVMKQFSIEPQSVKAGAMRQTVQECEAAAIEGEEKTCATSLESMLDFTTSQLEKGAESISTEVDKEQTPEQEYTIGPGGVKQMGGERFVVCHRESYPYAVFYCHKIESTKVYKVAMVGADGTKAAAVAVCHTDTSKWNPKHLAFQLLKVKPGTVPVCHFLPEDSIVWFSN